MHAHRPRDSPRAWRNHISRPAAGASRLRPLPRMTDPAPILELIDAFRRSKTMFVAVKLGIFDGVRPKGAAMDRLLDARVGLGLLVRQGADYVNTPVADEYLTASSPRTISGYIRYSNDSLYRLWE